MSLKSFEDELKRATEHPAFSNGFEGECWQDYWCNSCARSVDGEGCVLFAVALMGQTPWQWELLNRDSLTTRFICHEYVRSADAAAHQHDEMIDKPHDR